MRIGVVCEGATERDFVRRCLAPYVRGRRPDVDLVSVILCSPSGKGRGGNVSVDRLGGFCVRQYLRFDHLTTLVDLYGFRDCDGQSAVQLEREIAGYVQGHYGSDVLWRFRPYVQQYEFEALLLSDVSAFGRVSVFQGQADAISRLEKEVAHFLSPEDINHGPRTAPSKRIQSAFPGCSYNKVVHGSLVGLEVGIEKMRAVCPRFNLWVAMLEDGEKFPRPPYWDRQGE